MVTGAVRVGNKKRAHGLGQHHADATFIYSKAGVFVVIERYARWHRNVVPEYDIVVIMTSIKTTIYA